VRRGYEGFQEFVPEQLLQAKAIYREVQLHMLGSGRKLLRDGFSIHQQWRL
jgi:hypothetical protein